MRKDKVAAIALSLCLAAGLTACGGGEKADDTQESQQTQEGTQGQEAGRLTYEGVRSAQIEIDLEKQISSLSDYNGIDVTITGDYDVTDESVETTLLQLLNYMGAGTTEVTGRDVVEEGDYVMIDYTGYKDDVAFEGGTATDVLMDPVNNVVATTQTPYIDGFCKDLIGAKVGDVLRTDVTFPENYSSEELAGAPAVFEITVKGIYAPVTLDTLTDGAVEEAFSDSGITTKEGLLEYVETMLTNQMAAYKSQATVSAVQSYILEHSEVEIPEDYMQARMAELEYSTEADNCSEGQTLEEFMEANGTTLEAERENWKSSLTQQIKIEFLFGRIADLEKIEVDEEDFQQFVDYVIQSDGGGFASADDVYEYYGIGSREDGEKALKQLYRVNQAVSFVADHANVTVEPEGEAAAGGEEGAGTEAADGAEGAGTEAAD